MELIGIKNPFPGASSFLVTETESTQDEARKIASLGYPPGSLVAADLQTAGRGRFPERRWDSQAGKNLLFTIYLDPSAGKMSGLPLRAGLALCASVSGYASRLGARFGVEPRIKWPNDLMIGDKKAAGILCEAGPVGVFVGVGLNCNQTSFAPDLRDKATSLGLELGREVSRWAILELFLEVFERALAGSGWREAVNARLWRRGETLGFFPGAQARESGHRSPVVGLLEGVDDSGSILIRERGAQSATAYAAGELTVTPPLYKVEP